MIKLINLLALLILLYSSSSMAGLYGDQLYMQNCMVCHADDGTGAMPGVSDLTENKNLKTLTDQQIFKLLKQGVNKPGATVIMPPKGGNPDLTDSELKAIILFLRKELL